MSREGAQDLQAMVKLVSHWFLWRVPGRESNPGPFLRLLVPRGQNYDCSSSGGRELNGCQD